MMGDELDNKLSERRLLPVKLVVDRTRSGDARVTLKVRVNGQMRLFTATDANVEDAIARVYADAGVSP